MSILFTESNPQHDQEKKTQAVVKITIMPCSWVLLVRADFVS